MSGRIRTVKPEWLEDERLVQSSDAARVLSVGLLLLADDHGRGRASEIFLTARVFTGQPVEVLRAALARLVEIRYCRIYTVDEQSYFEVRNWTKHQKVDKPGREKVPPPLANDSRAVANPLDSHENDTETVSSAHGSLGGTSSEQDSQLSDSAKVSTDSRKFSKNLESLAMTTDSLAPRAIPSSSSSLPSSEGVQGEPVPDRPADDDRERKMALDWEPHPAAVADLAQHFGVSLAAVLEVAAGFKTYWVLGGGAGKARRNWQARFRDEVLLAHRQGRLVAPGAPPPPNPEHEKKLARAHRDAKKLEAQLGGKFRVDEVTYDITAE